MIGQIKPNLGSEKKAEITNYLKTMWDRAEKARSQEVNHFYKMWDRAYRAVPNQKTRNFPWPNASNIVVPIIRMYTDTFIARTLNVVFNTRPLVAVSGYPSDVRAAWEEYLDLKCRQDWNMYEFARGSLVRGNKYGTNMAKVFWKEDEVQIPMQTFEDEGDTKVEAIPATRYSGPWADYVSFDDWFLYPITVNRLEDAEVIFHRIRYTEETAAAVNSEREWGLTQEEIQNALRFPSDAKRTQEQSDAGVSDSDYREMQVVECHFDWDVQDSTFRCIAEFEPVNAKLLSFGLSQYPPQVPLFYDYRPFPRDDVFPGESMCQILGQGQEEVSSIHNERRNLSVMASAPLVLTKEGARIPGAGTAFFYPGKNYVLEDMDDFRVEVIGGNYQDMIAEENHTLSLMDRVSGISAGMQAASQGGQGKGGVYNTQGTMAVMAEGNQRQDTNIKDFRLYLGNVIKAMVALQREMNPDDPTIAQLAPEMQPLVRRAMEMSTPEMLSRSVFEVRVSDAAMNKEARKANLMTMANTLNQFAQAQQQLLPLAIDQTANPILKQFAGETLKMQHGLAKALFDEFGLHGMIDDIPNAPRILQSSAGPSGGAPQGQPPIPGGMGSPNQAGPVGGMAAVPAVRPQQG